MNVDLISENGEKRCSFVFTLAVKFTVCCSTTIKGKSVLFVAVVPQLEAQPLKVSLFQAPRWSEKQIEKTN